MFPVYIILFWKKHKYVGWIIKKTNEPEKKQQKTQTFKEWIGVSVLLQWTFAGPWLFWLRDGK